MTEREREVLDAVARSMAAAEMCTKVLEEVYWGVSTLEQCSSAIALASRARDEAGEAIREFLRRRVDDV